MIRTSRLTLRPHRIDDAAEWHAIQSHPEVLRFVPWPERDAAASRRHLAHRTRRTRLLHRDDFLALAVDLDGRLIGDVAMHLRDVSPSHRTVEISWIIDPRHGRKGYATEATTAVLDTVYDELQARRVLAMIDDRNERSIALARRLGFERVAPGVFRANTPRRELQLAS